MNFGHRSWVATGGVVVDDEDFSARMLGEGEEGGRDQGGFVADGEEDG